MRILLANPRGFCAGVVMAIESLERALQLLGPPLYVYHEIVHNRHIVDSFRGRGVVFVEDLEEVPEGSTLLYSAHGVSPAVRRHAARRLLHTIDATCPLVAKVHLEAVHFGRLGYTIVLIGHAGHAEVVGTLGEAPDHIQLVHSVADVERLQVVDEDRVAYLTQTTLSLDEAADIVAALRRRFPRVVGPAKDDICYATQNRQDTVKELVAEADVVLVVGSQNSSNCQRLREVAARAGKPAYLVDDAGELRQEWFRDGDVVLLTAGASAPEPLVGQCAALLCEWFAAVVEQRDGREEHVRFALPRELRERAGETRLLPLTLASEG
jgi:4-hydroxy-3-methylbut-2-enyl diphosphate reductase